MNALSPGRPRASRPAGWRGLCQVLLPLLAGAALLAAGPVKAQSLTFESLPTDTASGQPINAAFGTPGVTIHDANASGRPIMAASVTISLTPNGGSGTGTLTTSTSLTGTTDGNGNLTFTGLMIDKTGTYELTVTDPTNGTSGTSATSNQFTITPGPFSRLAFTQQPVSAPQGFALNTGTNPQGVVVQAQDAAGNAVTGGSQAVTITLGGSGGTLTTQAGATNGTGTTQTATGTTDGSGNIAFTALKVSPTGTYTLVATAPVTTGMTTTNTTVTSQPFSITQFSNGVVTSTQDDGTQGTLRSVLANAAPGATVTFDPTVFPPFNTQVIRTDNGGEIRIARSVSVVGPSPAGVVVTADGNSRVFGVTGGPVSMSNLIIEGGRAPFFGPGGEGAPFFGQGGGVAVSGGGVLTLTHCTIQNDGAYNNGSGGGVYNAGALALIDCTISGNGATYDGGGVYSDGMTFLAGCAVLNNRANNNGQGGVGGGVFSDGPALTVTSCSFSQNSADQGYDVFNVGGTATLTDDVFYFGGNNGGSNNATGPTEIDGSNLTVSFSDVAGGTGQEDANGNSMPFPGVGNVDVYPSYNNNNGDLHLNTQSRLIGRGTTNAPGFQAADHDGTLYFQHPSMGAFEGALDETSGTHVLWTNPDGQTIVWNLPGATVSAANGDPADNLLILGKYAPQDDGAAPYTAVSLATTPNFNFSRIIIGGLARPNAARPNAVRPNAVNNSGGAPAATSYVLWNAPDGHVMLWAVNDATGAVTRFTYGPFSDDGTASTIWQATAVSAGGDGLVHILWDNPNGRTILWDVQPADGSPNAGQFTIRGNYNGFSDDGTPNTVWKAVGLASGPDGLNHVLFNNADNHTLIWNLDQNDDQPAGSGNPATASSETSSTFSTYGLFSDDGSMNTIWKARAISVGPDNFTHLLWNNPNGRTIFWKVNRDGSFAIVSNVGPPVSPSGQSGFTAVALATTQDNQSHFAWDSTGGETLFSDVNQNGSLTSLFFPAFMEDGTTDTTWQAVALSASPQNNFL